MDYFREKETPEEENDSDCGCERDWQYDGELEELGIHEASEGNGENEGSNDGAEEFLNQILELQRQSAHSTHFS